MGAVELLSKVLDKTLGKQNGRSRAYAEGYAAGILRRRGQRLQMYPMVRIDAWDQGFRDGYFGRLSSDSAQVPMASISETAQKSLQMQAN